MTIPAGYDHGFFTESKCLGNDVPTVVTPSIQMTEKIASPSAEWSGDELRSVIDTAHEAFVSMDADGVITYWNPEAERIFGWSREEAIGRVLAETIIPQQYRESHWRGLESLPLDW